jgi:GNAT superfamily N-acetyltransferase
MIAVRPARPADAVAIGAVHVAVWRSAYAGILPDAYLARLSVSRHAAHYGAGGALAEGEIETLYVLDDWRDQGVGRALMEAAAAHLRGLGCQSAFLWVLRDNPSRWFYQRLGGRMAMDMEIPFAGENVVQRAFVWDPIDRLLTATAKGAG